MVGVPDVPAAVDDVTILKTGHDFY